MTDDPEVLQDLESARHLVDMGVPVFVAKKASPGMAGSGGTGFQIPRGWQDTQPDPSIIDSWEPGDALCAVMGHLVDGIDVDTSKGGDRQLLNGTMPKTYGSQRTRSGGTHDLISALGMPSRDGFLPAIDYKGGAPEGSGRGFLYIAPTSRPHPEGGPLVKYRWTVRPDLAPLLMEDDSSGGSLADLVQSSRRKTKTGVPGYLGLAFDSLHQAFQEQARSYTDQRLKMWRDILSDAAGWPDGQTDTRGRGWELLARDSAWAIASLAVCPWTPMKETEAKSVYDALLPEELAGNKKCQGKWYDGILEKAAAAPSDQPPWADFEPVTTIDGEDRGIPEHLDDSRMAEWMYQIGLGRAWRFAPGLGWMHWTGKQWKNDSEDAVKNAVRMIMININLIASDVVANKTVMKQIQNLMTVGKISAVISLMRGVSLVDGNMFDANAHLLNVANGVVDLRTGKLLDHDPSHLLTKITKVNYRPGATHPDWAQALTALDPEVADWMKIRFGQAATGNMTSDDILPIGQGDGSNGKTTMLSAIKAAMGEHMVQVPEKLLRANPNDHPTELMTLYGARIAVIDETPEAGHINVQRLKAILGSEYMTARKIHKDNVTWAATHSLFVMTNYIPRVAETDRGTWRRLALVRFTKTFPQDDRFRARLVKGKDGISEAVLAWVVEGARRWYGNEELIPQPPQRVKDDTFAWRAESDQVLSYITERLVFDPEASITSSDLLDDVNEWLEQRNHRRWSDQLLASRFSGHYLILEKDVNKIRARTTTSGLVPRYAGLAPAGKMVAIWQGVRWRTDGDEAPE